MIFELNARIALLGRDPFLSRKSFGQIRHLRLICLPQSLYTPPSGHRLIAMFAQIDTLPRAEY